MWNLRIANLVSPVDELIKAEGIRASFGYLPAYCIENPKVTRDMIL